MWLTILLELQGISEVQAEEPAPAMVAAALPDVVDNAATAAESSLTASPTLDPTESSEPLRTPLVTAEAKQQASTFAISEFAGALNSQMSKPDYTHHLSQCHLFRQVSFQQCHPLSLKNMWM